MGNDESYSFSIHGVAAHVQNEPDTADDIRRNSQGTRVRQNGGGNWIHLAVPTPTMLKDKWVSCGNITIRARTNRNATINKVHVYEGTTCEKRVNDLRWTDRDFIDESIDIGGLVHNGVAVCIYVEFDRVGDPDREDVGEVTIYSVHGGFYRVIGRVD